MGNQADRMRDQIHAAASGDFASALDELAKLADALNRHGDSVARLLMDHNGEFVHLWDDQAALRDEMHDGLNALANRIESVAKMDLSDYALQNDLDSLRSEMHAAIAEATATPFDTEPPHAA